MINKVTLVGRAGKEPGSRTIENGTVVTNFSLATSESWKDKSGEKKERTEWHNIVMWRGLAEIAAKYVHKGDLLYIGGKITTRSYEKDGTTRYITEIVADEMKMLGEKRDEGSKVRTNSIPSGTSSVSDHVSDGPKDDDDNLPF